MMDFSISSAVSPGAVTSVGGGGGVPDAMLGAQAPAGLGERFRAALAQARLEPQQAGHGTGPSAVSQAVASQDRTFSELTRKIDAFEASSGALSMQQVQAQSLQIQREITEEMVKIYTGTAVAQGGKSTVQTLMKNQ